MNITNQREWWECVHNNWSDIFDVIADQMDLSHEAYATPGDPRSQTTAHNIAEEVVHLQDMEDPKLGRYIYAAWKQATGEYAWTTPGWEPLSELYEALGVFVEELHFQGLKESP